MKENIKKKIEKKKTNPKTKGYWRIYDLRYKKYNLQTTYALILSITNI